MTAIEMLTLIMGNYLAYYRTRARQFCAGSDLARALDEINCDGGDFNWAHSDLTPFAGQEINYGVTINFLRRGLWLAVKYAVGGIDALNQDFAIWLAMLREDNAPVTELVKIMNDRLYDAIYFLPHAIFGVSIKLDPEQIAIHRADQKWYSHTTAYSRLHQLGEVLGAEPTTFQTLLPFGINEFGSHDQPRSQNHMDEIGFSCYGYRGMGITPTLELNLDGRTRGNHFLVDDVQSISFVGEPGNYSPCYDHGAQDKLWQRWSAANHYLNFRGWCGNSSQSDIPEVSLAESGWLRDHRCFPPSRREFFDDGMWGGEAQYRLVADQTGRSEPILYEIESAIYELYDQLGATKLLHQFHLGEITPKTYVGQQLIERLATIPFIPAH